MTQNKTDNLMENFSAWFKNYHGTDAKPKDVVLTALCGYAHTYTKMAETLLKEAKKKGICSERLGMIFFK